MNNNLSHSVQHGIRASIILATVHHPLTTSLVKSKQKKSLSPCPPVISSHPRSQPSPPLSSFLFHRQAHRPPSLFSPPCSPSLALCYCRRTLPWPRRRCPCLDQRLSLSEFIRGCSRKRKTRMVPVYLNVYNLTSTNTYWLGLGVYHSSVQVQGVEYAYGVHEHATTGIFEAEPRQCPGFVFRKSILIGRTDLGQREVRVLMEELATEYTGNTYNLISKNCNHFCNEACLRLTNKRIPRWVNRLARIGFLCNCVLPVQVAAVKSRRDEAEGNREGERRKLRSNSTRFPPPTTSTSTTAAPISSVPSSETTRSRRISRRSSSSSSVSSTLKI